MALLSTNQQQQQYPIVAGYAFKTAFTFAAVGSTVILTNASAGIYRFNVSAIITTAQGSDTLTVNALYTDDQQAETIAVLNAVSTASQGQFNGSAIIENTAAANISYSVTTTATTAVGNIYILIERLF